jgi:DNA-binding phage protein
MGQDDPGGGHRHRLSVVKQTGVRRGAIMDLKRPEIEQLLRRHIEQSGGLSQWARRTGLSREHLSRVLHGHKQIGPKIMRALKLHEVPSPGPRKALSALRKEITKAGSQLEWARRAGVNRTTLNQVLNGRKNPTPDILRALNVRTVVIYQPRRAGRKPVELVDDAISGGAGDATSKATNGCAVVLKAKSFEPG